MKALGARTGQLAQLYAGAVAALGAIACGIALPLGALGAHALVRGLAAMLNLAIADPTIPPWVFGVEVAAGIAVPLALAALPILGACRLTVRAALDQHGARSGPVRPAIARLPMVMRDALRRPARLALTLALLGAGGALVMTACNVKRAYEASVARMPRMWHHDLEIRLLEPAPVALAAALGAVPGVRIAEAWGFGAAAIARSRPPAQVQAQAQVIDTVRTYPDQGHGSFPVLGVPPRSALIDLPLVSGRWLVPGDRDAIVVGIGAGRRVGDALSLSFDGVASEWTVVGVVDALPASGGYVTDTAFAAATHAGSAAREIRVATTARSPGELRVITARVEHELAQRGAAVSAVIPFGTFREAIDAHVVILVRAAVVIAAIIALVGLFGLAAAIGIGVVARTRELGAMKAVGASDRRIFRIVVGEALLVGAASWLASALVSIPASAAMVHFLAGLGFVSPELATSPGALAGWLLAVVAGSGLAALAPARRAMRLTVREALAEA